MSLVTLILPTSLHTHDKYTFCFVGVRAKGNTGIILYSTIKYHRSVPHPKTKNQWGVRIHAIANLQM